MKIIALALTGIVLCAVPDHGETGEEISAAVTDMPDIIDMSYADPKTWHSLPTEVSDPFSDEKVGQVPFSSRSRPF